MIDTDTIRKAEEQARVCSVFSNPKRILILWMLAHSEMTVSEIAQEMDCTIQNISQHLRLIRGTGILASRREAQNIYYSISTVEQCQSCQLILDLGLAIEPSNSTI